MTEDLIVQRAGVHRHMNIVIGLVIGIETNSHVRDVAENYTSYTVNNGKINILDLKGQYLLDQFFRKIKERHGVYLKIPLQVAHIKFLSIVSLAS